MLTDFFLGQRTCALWHVVGVVHEDLVCIRDDEVSTEQAEELVRLYILHHIIYQSAGVKG